MKKSFARHIWLLAIGMLAISLNKCNCTNSPKKNSTPPDSPNPPDTRDGAMVKRAKEKGRSNFLIKKLQEVENKVVGMDINERQVGTQNTALHEAVSLGDIELIKYLLANHADRKVKNSNNETAFDIASKQGFSQSLLDELHKELEGDPSTSGPETDPPGGTKNLFSPFRNNVSYFIKGDCGHDEYICENVGDPGHGYYEIMLKPGVRLKDELKMLEEQDKQRNEKLKRGLAESRKKLEEHQKWLKEAKEHDLKFKNGKIFLPRIRTANVEKAKSFLDFIKENIQRVNVTP